jgi:uncharacterized protein (DUF1778 family)
MGSKKRGRPRRIDIVNTRRQIACMTTSRTVGAVDRTLPAQPPVVERKESINLRVGAETRRLIDSAAAMLGKSRTEFMLDFARQAAIDVLLDQQLFDLDEASYDAFKTALENPPPAGPKLRALMRRKPIWEIAP